RIEWSVPRGPRAEPARPREGGGGAHQAALSGGRARQPSGGGPAGAELELCTGPLRGVPKGSRGISAARSPRRHAGAKGSGTDSGQGSAAIMACSHHTVEGPETDVATADQGHHGGEASRSKTTPGSHPVAGRRL